MTTLAVLAGAYAGWVYFQDQRAVPELVEEVPEELRERSRGIGEIRGAGLMIALEIDGDAPAVAKRCLERGLVLHAVRPHTLRLLPPLVITPEDVAEAALFFASEHRFLSHYFAPSTV